MIVAYFRWKHSADVAPIKMICMVRFWCRTDQPHRRHHGIISKKVKKGSFYIAQYPRWTAQSALHFLPPLTDLFIPTPTRLLREAF